jgi:hypothetical protein
MLVEISPYFVAIAETAHERLRKAIIARWPAVVGRMPTPNEGGLRGRRRPTAYPTKKV